MAKYQAEEDPSFLYSTMFREYCEMKGYMKNGVMTKDFRIKTKEQAIEMMEEYHQGEDLMFSAARLICVSFSSRILKMISTHIKRNGTAMRDDKRKDLENICYQTVYNCLRSFDPERDGEDFFYGRLDSVISRHLGKKSDSDVKVTVHFGITQDDRDYAQPLSIEELISLHETFMRGYEMVSGVYAEVYFGLKYFITKRINARLENTRGDQRRTLSNTLESACFEGIVDGLKSYDPEISLPITYLSRNIEGAISKNLSGDNIGSIGPKQRRGLNAVKDAINRFEMGGIYDWTSADISLMTHMHVDQVEGILNWMAMKDARSLSEYMEESGDSSPFLMSQDPSVEDQVILQEMQERMRTAISQSLEEIDQYIVSLSFGLDGSSDKSVAYITKSVNEIYGTNYDQNQVRAKLEKALGALGRNSSIASLHPHARVKQEQALRKFQGHLASEDISLQDIDSLFGGMQEEQADVVQIRFGPQ